MERKRIVIRLTDRRPVRIYEDEWPIVASAGTGETDTGVGWQLEARQHADGRIVVYGYLRVKDDDEWQGGLLVIHPTSDGKDVVSLLNEIGKMGNFPPFYVQDCI